MELMSSLVSCAHGGIQMRAFPIACRPMAKVCISRRLQPALSDVLQMERRLGRTHDPLRFHVARHILQKGLQMNPDSGCLAQAWGLMELQRGNVWAAVRLLERSVDMDPFLKPVLKWKPVSIARMTVRAAGISRSSSRAAARMGCASAGAGAVSGTAGASAAAANGGKGQLSHDVSSPANSSSNSSAGGSCMSSL
eukprot:GHUV01042099.1.p1 GENE.GHUV01042099.1~~GHUV01042099.1.p1  ORF type:complete len:195 (+),score=66.28 GHUV01042099.1:33-617(+)